ncbi:hypothetical protein VY88_31860 [Azospirillum thiophilum]|uniref:Uncharacterized protein n=1 Tax=Azospirillum thiophilum TaxID=528244 RepID=A0AAC8VZF7_9PROT|nr:hypothetical protein [Azospirillum thiophilum]ALG72344.1 hypothetical protein AL072_14575 [Azospirillum thiophilum]KJR61307.1 hypothetical protein VY88_31860 [Azospirillum thiophilum]
MSNLHPFPGSSFPGSAAGAPAPSLPLPFDPAMPPALRSRMLREALPEALQRLLDGGQVGRHSRFTDDGFAGVVEEWTPPDEVTPRHAALARRALAEIDDGILAPAPANHLLGRVLALLSHFPAKATTPEVEQLLAMDWADDLGEFPAWAIDQAARIWRRTRKWRPSIAEIRALCEEACTAERGLADRLRAIATAGDRTGDGGAGAAAVRPVLASAVRRMR